MIFTIGHSTLTRNQLLSRLNEHDIDLLVDVRSIPFSRWNPHMNRSTLEPFLVEQGIDYWHHVELGGGIHQPVHADTSVDALPVMFKDFANYCQTPYGKTELNLLMWQSEYNRAAIMCSERDWTQCHRRIISDNLHVRGCKVMHIIDENLVPHEMLTYHVYRNDTLTYPLKPINSLPFGED